MTSLNNNSGLLTYCKSADRDEPDESLFKDEFSEDEYDADMFEPGHYQDEPDEEPAHDNHSSCIDTVPSDEEGEIPNKYLSEWWSAASFVGETYGDTAKDKQRAKGTTNMPAPPTILGDFFKTKGYRGSVHGYYFGTGLKGTGYYKTTAEDSGRPATPISLDGMARKTTLSSLLLRTGLRR